MGNSRNTFVEVGWQAEPVGARSKRRSITWPEHIWRIYYCSTRFGGERASLGVCIQATTNHEVLELQSGRRIQAVRIWSIFRSIKVFCVPYFCRMPLLS